MKDSNNDPVAAYLELARHRPELFDRTRERGSNTIEILMERADMARAQQAAFEARSRHGLPTDDVRVGVLAADPYMVLLRDAVRFPDGSLGLYNRVLEGHCVGAVPILDGKLVLVRIFRHALRAWATEFPRGSCDPNEPPEDAIRRELREEIGAEVTELTNIGRFALGSSTLAIPATHFVARIDRIGQPSRHDAIERLLVCDVAEVEDLIRGGEIIDGWTLSLFLRARLAGYI